MIESQDNTVIIEFTGLPGVGKTYLKGRLVSELEVRNEKPYIPLALVNERRSYQIFIKFFTVIGFSLRNPTVLLLLVKAFGRDFHSKLLSNWLFILASVQRAEGFSYGILDQGIVQAIWSCQYRGIQCKTKPLAEAIVQVLKKAAITRITIVHVFADIDDHTKWLHSRKNGLSPLEGADPKKLEELSNSLPTALGTFRELNLEELCGVEIEIIEFQNTPNVSALELVADLLKTTGKV